MKKHTEDRFEDAIEYQFLEKDCYVKGTSDEFDTERAIEPTRVIAFIENGCCLYKKLKDECIASYLLYPLKRES